MINWIDSEVELPPDNSIVAVIDYHGKECWPNSVEITFGEVESYILDGERIVSVNTCDFTGYGSSRKYFGLYSNDRLVAWAYARDFKKPSFVRHNPHWGEV